MRFIIATASFIAMAALVGATAAFAQTAARGDLDQTWSAPPSATAEQAPQTLFSFGGFNAVVNAPVDAPDSNLAYGTFEGQPMRGGDAIIAGG